jgi:hypothetical protein
VSMPATGEETPWSGYGAKDAKVKDEDEHGGLKALTLPA